MSHAGFDSLAYPGDAMMQWLKSHTNLSFVGFYLAPAPSRPTSGWMGKYTTLAAQGWGFAPIYVGQQEASQPGSHTLTVDQGTIDGRAAIGLMQTAGFPRGSVVYLDCEQGGRASPGVHAYVGAWVDAVAPGSYTPGIYCSYTTAASLLAIRPNVCVWVWHITNPAPGPSFPTPNPSSSGVSTAVVWQYFQNTTVQFPGAPSSSLKIDLDSASLADPSKASVAVAAAVVSTRAPGSAAEVPAPAPAAAPAKKATKSKGSPKKTAKKAAAKAGKTKAGKTKAGKTKAGKKGRTTGRKTGH